MIHVPVTFETYGICGAASVTPSSDLAERLEGRLHHRRVERVRRVQRSASTPGRRELALERRERLALGPDTVQSAGALTAAISTPAAAAR